MRIAILLGCGALLAGVALTTIPSLVNAAVLCRKRSGVVVVRDACKRKETPLDPATFGVVGPAGPTGPAGPPGPAPGCPEGTALHELACIELAQRNAASWTQALSTCRQFSRRLLTMAELSTFRFRTDLDPPTVGSEWTDHLSGPLGSELGTYLTMNTGTPGTADADSASFTFRCAAPATP